MSQEMREIAMRLQIARIIRGYRIKNFSSLALYLL